jgi:hypothetical protein
MSERLWILVAGPYATGAATPAERAANLRRLNEAALAVQRLGHVPVIGVNAALPLIELAGDAHYDAIMLPLSLALAERCDAVLRIGGTSSGADREVERIRARGGRVYRSLDEIRAPRRHTFERAFLALGALVLVAYAVGFLLDPALLGRLVGLRFEEANAFVEIRAFYGGLELGLAAFLALAAVRPVHARAALVLFALAFGAAGLARFAGIVEYGSTGASQPLVAAIEVAGAVAAAALTRRA